MAYFMTTELGREVVLNDWLGFHRDRVLSVLYQMRQQGVPRPGLQLSAIASVTGLPRGDAAVLVDQMVKDGFLDRDGPVLRMTEKGSQWVRESPGT